MNIIAIDIGNTNVTIGLYVDDSEKGLIKLAGNDCAGIAVAIKDFWSQIPVMASSKEKKRDGHIVIASVRPEWAGSVREIVADELGEKVHEIGVDKDVPLPMELAVDEPGKVGVDRVMSAFAAYSVVGDAVAIADLGTAVTIDLVSEEGVFLGGTIFPGFEVAARSLGTDITSLPDVGRVHEPGKPFGRNTAEAINNGIYYSAVGAIETIARMYADELGKWPQTIVTGGNMPIVKAGCSFVDTFVTDLALKGIVLAYKKYIEEKS